jgi:hypothetical protein
MMKKLWKKILEWLRRELDKKPDIKKDEPKKEEPKKPVEPTPPAATCNCSSERIGYKAAKEQIAIAGPSKDLRCLLNDNTENESWITNLVVDDKHVKFNGNIMTVECFKLAEGVMAHFVGWKQPSSGGPMIKDSMVVSGNGTLRLYFESRKSK